MFREVVVIGKLRRYLKGSFFNFGGFKFYKPHIKLVPDNIQQAK